MRKLLILFFCLLVKIYTSQAQPRVRFEALLSGMELDGSTVNDIMQDQKGFLWFATDAGFFRYDGHTYNSYQYDITDQSMLNYNAATSLLEDSDGDIWMGSFGGGLLKLDKNTNRFQQYIHQSQDTTSIPSNLISDVFEDKKNRLWVGTKDKGLMLYNKEKQSFVLYSHNPNDVKSLGGHEVRTVFEDSKGRVWVATRNGGLHLYNESANNFIRYQHDPEDQHSISSNDIMAIFEVDGVLWIGTWGGGLNRFDESTHSFVHYKKETGNPNSLGANEIWCITEDQQGQLLIGTSGSGLVVFDRKTEKFVSYKPEVGNPNSLGAIVVRSIYRDKEGLLWLGTYDEGIYKTAKDTEAFSLLLSSNQLNNKAIQSIVEFPGGMLWLGTIAGGLYRYDLNSGNIHHINFVKGYDNWISANTILDLHGGRDGNLWCATSQGLYKVDPLNGNFSSHLIAEAHKVQQNIFFSIAESEDGYLWLGMRRGGIFRFDSKVGKFERYFPNEKFPQPITNNESNNIAVDQHGNLWAGSEAGLYFLNKEDSDQNFFSTSNSQGITGLSDNRITAINYSTKSQNIWIGTAAGLNDYNPEIEKFTTYSKEDGLSNNYIRDIVQDESGHLWMSTSYGLSKFYPKTKKFENYYTKDGLQDNEGILYKSPYSSFIYYGGKKGLNRFDPATLNKTAYQAPITISAFEYSEKEGEEVEMVTMLNIENKKEVSLRYHNDLIKISYASLSYTNPDRIQYAYQLEGQTNDWIRAGTANEVTFTKLPPGDYTFHVKTISSEGVLSENEARLSLHISPPWWQTIWAYLLYAAAIILLLTAFYRYQRRRWQLQTALQLEQQEAERLKALDTFKTNLYTNITHEFRTPLTVILGLSNLIHEQLPTISPDKIKKHLDAIDRNGKGLLGLVNQMLDLSKLEAGKLQFHFIQNDIIAYLKYLTDSFHSLAENKSIQIHFEALDEALLMDFDPERIRQIFSNLLSNAIKFTPKNGSVFVSAQSTDSATNFALHIQDTGIGIAPEQLPYIFDRFYQISQSKNGKTNYSSGGGGTGIGLALTKELIEQMGGNIQVESIVGQGTTFFVQLPISRKAPFAEFNKTIAPIVAGEKEVNEEDIALQTDQPNDLSLVLLIEDNSDVRAYIRATLGEDYKILEAVNGQQGIDMAIEYIPDLIVSDVMMPEKDGFEVCQTLKQDERSSHIPIILLTAKADVDSRLEGLEYGADAYLAKPFHKEELLIRIRKLIELRKQLQARYQNLSAPLPKTTKTLAVEDEFVQKVKAAIEAHLDDPEFGVEEVSKAIFLSRTQVHRKLKALTGKSTGQFIHSVRLHTAKKMLEEQDMSVTQVAFEVGYKELSYFSRLFSAEFGCSPSSVAGKTN